VKSCSAQITGTAAEIIPVVKVDSRAIGTGKPGAMTINLEKPSNS
jgi:branched-chain amino acid aminotransferase